MPSMKSQNYKPPAEPTPVDPYQQALSLIRQVDNAKYRAAMTDALIVEHTRRVLGYPDPGGPLAMKLRREAAAAS